jgi:hypothetical protein
VKAGSERVSAQVGQRNVQQVFRDVIRLGVGLLV